MSCRWPFTLTLTVDLVRKSIESQGWSLSIDSVEYLGQGWDNVAFLVNDELVFRFAKTEHTAQLLARENLVLPHLQHLSLQIPNPIYIGTPNKNNVYHFHGYKKLQGMPAYQVDFSDKQLKKMLQSIAVFLKELHSYTAQKAQALGAKAVIYDRTNTAKVVDSLEQRLQKLNELHAIKFDQSFINQEIERAYTIRLSRDSDCLVHGDFDIRHFLVIENRMSGIIDWGDVGICHPVVDIAAIFCWFPEYMHPVFFDIYGAVSQDVQQYAKFIALNRAITFMWYGYEINDKKMIQIATQAYERLKSHQNN